MLVTIVVKFWENLFLLFSNNHEYVVLTYRYNKPLAFLIAFSLAMNGFAVAANIRLHPPTEKPISLEIPRGREDEDIDVRKRRLSRLLED